MWAKQVNLIVIGLDNAGKTSLLNLLAHGQHIESIPTLGVDTKYMRHKGFQIRLYDVGGQDSQRVSWDEYAKESNCIIFVIDAADPNRLETARDALHNFLANKNTHGKPVLIAVNKIDIPRRLSKFEIIKGLRVDSITKNIVAIIEISTLDNQEINKVIEWIITNAP